MNHGLRGKAVAFIFGKEARGFVPGFGLARRFWTRCVSPLNDWSLNVWFNPEYQSYGKAFYRSLAGREINSFLTRRGKSEIASGGFERPNA